MAPVKPSATYVDDWSVEIRTPFDAAFVFHFKQEIPAPYRFWDPIHKVWTVQAADPGWAELAVNLLLEFFPYATVQGKVRSSTKTKRGRGSVDQDFTTLHLLPSAPPALVRAARKVLSLELHPDRGGTHEAMVALNLAYERLEDRGYA